MTQEELHIWQTLAQSKDPIVSGQASARLSAFQKGLYREGLHEIKQDSLQGLARRLSET